MGVVEGPSRQAAQHATEYATPNHILRADRLAQVFSDRGEAARALDEESVVAGQDSSSCWLWVMSGLPQVQQGAGGAGSVALEAD